MFGSSGNKGLLKDGCNVVVCCVNLCYVFCFATSIISMRAIPSLLSVVIMWWHSRNVPKITTTTLYLGFNFCRTSYSLRCFKMNVAHDRRGRGL